VGGDPVRLIYGVDMRHPGRRIAAAAALAVLLGACASDDSCEPAPPTAACSDLDFRGVMYNELWEIDAPPPNRMQELGNATYPDCNVAEGCPGSELDGYGATDVYQIKGVDFADAVIGVRQNSDTYVIFLRVGADAGELPLPRDRYPAAG
jgi:hypothetical protein